MNVGNSASEHNGDHGTWYLPSIFLCGVIDVPYCFVHALISLLSTIGECSEMDTLLSLSQVPGSIPSKKRMYLNRDFIKQGQVNVTINDITNFTVYMWDNRFVKELTFDREHIPPVTEEYRLKTLGEIEFFRGKCWTNISLETKQMLVIEVNKAFRDVSNRRVTKWNDAAKLLNKHYADSKEEDASVSYACCYGEAFSGNWAKYGQNSFMESNNIEFRVWDLLHKQCPNGFISHMFSATKGHHVKKVPHATAKLGKSGFLSKKKINGVGTKGALGCQVVYKECKDPNFLDVRQISSKLTDEFSSQGINNPSVADVRKLLFRMRKANNSLSLRLSAASAHVQTTVTGIDGHQASKPDEGLMDDDCEEDDHSAHDSLRNELVRVLWRFNPVIDSAFRYHMQLFLTYLFLVHI